MSDVDPEEAPKIRKYLDKYADHCRRNEWKLYSGNELSKYKSLKPVLSNRSQFDDPKRDFQKDLLKKLMVQD